MWTVGLTVERKLRFQIPPVWRAFLKKLRFGDGLVWTVSLTAEIKHAFSNFSGVGVDAAWEINYRTFLWYRMRCFFRKLHSITFPFNDKIMDVEAKVNTLTALHKMNIVYSRGNTMRIFNLYFTKLLAPLIDCLKSKLCLVWLPRNRPKSEYFFRTIVPFPGLSSCTAQG